MNRGADGSSPSASRISLTRLARFFSTTNVAGHRRSWRSLLEIAFGRSATRMHNRSNAFGDSATRWPPRSSSRVSGSSTNDPKCTGIGALYRKPARLAKVELLESVDHEQVAKSSQVGITVSLRVRRDGHAAPEVFDSDGVRRRERSPEHTIATADLDAEHLDG